MFMGKRIALLGSVALLGAPDIAQAQSTPSPTLLDTYRQKIEIIDARNQALISRNAGLMTENEALRRELAALKGGKAPSKTGAPLPSSVVRANNTPVFPDSDPPSSPLRTLPPARIVPSLAPRPVQGPQDYVFRTHLDGYIKSGRERTLAGTELWIPLTWNGELLTFADARLVADDSEGREGNFGLGARLLPAGWPALVGGYAYYDRRRSESGSVFEQATLGAELLSSEWDLRANVYLALSDPSISEYSSLDTDFALRGRTIIATQTATENIVRETPLSGFDLEAGHKVSFLEGSWMDDTRAYASWYHFDGDGVDPVDGYRIRLRTSLTDWLQVGLEHQDDGLRGSDQFAELRVRFPFGDTPRSHRPRGLYKRLDERVVRDIDIVTASATATQSQT
ncbi:MAG TPA: inverse autotransporter beta domain-containing protein, partial [Alphaproteobacteria bacterium]|nr:inverse autotransporter beta domain-containing protein [Alphaproteobacteria bacterium]